MEAAIMTVVSTFLKSAKGKENLDGKAFQKMVSSQLGGIMEVKNSIIVTALHHTLFHINNTSTCFFDHINT